MITIILVNWNGWGDTLECVDSILKSDYQDYRIIIVDNNSDDLSVNFIQNWFFANKNYFAKNSSDNKSERKILFNKYIYKSSLSELNSINNPSESTNVNYMDVFLVQSDINGGFGYGCNIGLRLGQSLGSSAYWLLNNDCVISPTSLGMISKELENRPNVIFGTILMYYYKPNVIQVAGGGFFNRITGRVKSVNYLGNKKKLDFINGASLIISDFCYQEVGGFDKNIFMYFEENDFCIRAKRKGFAFELVETITYHKHGGSQGKVPSVASWRNVLINKEYVLHKHFGYGIWTILFYLTLCLRSIFSFGDENSRIGARQALIYLIFGVKAT